MKAFLYSLLRFTFIAIVGYISLTWLWGNLMTQAWKPNLNYSRGGHGHLLSRLNEVKEKKDLDILFLGSSHTYRGFDTRLFANDSTNVFNLGSSSQTPLQTGVLLDRYLKILNPKLVIYEVYPEIFTMDGVESANDLISNDENDCFSLNMAMRINHIKVYNTLIFSAIEQYFSKKKIQEKNVHGSDTYINGGFVQKELRYYSPTSIKPKTFEFKEHQINKFKEILATLNSNNCKVILVFAPVTKNEYKALGNLTIFNKQMHRFGEYYNFNELMTLDDSLHFYDAHHLNQQGVELFNHELKAILER